MKYHTGDHFYLERLDGTIDGWTVTDKQPSHYIDDNGKRIDYEMLSIKCDNPDFCDCLVEDYNVDYDKIEETDPRVAEYKQKVCTTESINEAAITYANKQTGWDLNKYEDQKDRQECINDFIEGAEWMRRKLERR